MKKATYSIHDYTFEGTNFQELRNIVNEVFDQHIYYFETDTPNPRIIDIGAHVGIATHYFARTHPTAEILAVEPHPVSYSLLQENCNWNRLTNVTTLQAAVVPNPSFSHEKPPSQTTLFTDKSGEWLSSTSTQNGGWNDGQEGMTEITIPAITLAKLIDDKPVQLLKMDIEGAEWEVLLRAGEELRNIERLILEYHPQRDRQLDKLVAALQQFQLRPFPPIPVSPKKRRQLQMLEFVNKKLAKKLQS
jgi:FkbM family methyltransferase